MAEITTYLSPNGIDTTRGEGPATKMLVATIEGVMTFSRSSQGAEWVRTNRSLTHRHIGSLLFESVSGKLFAGAHADGGLWVSDDGAGADWRQITNGLDRPHIYALASRRIGDKVTLFLGTSPAGFYRSEDFGETWTEVKSFLDVPGTEKWTFPPPPHIAHVKNIVFHPDDPETLFVGVEQGALLKSTDDGKSWTELSAYSDPDEVAYKDVHRLLIDPRNADKFYLATGEGMYRSDDGGVSWVHLTFRGDRMGYPDFLYFDPLDSGILYTGGSYRNPGFWMQAGLAESSVLRTTDRGNSWEELDNGLPKPVIGAFEAMAMHHWDGGMMLVVGTATGEIYVSEDRGASWHGISDDTAPVSKDDHHLPFMTPDQRKALKERAIA